MIEITIISGGRTGADQAGWRAARRFNLPTGGWMAEGFLTEDGPRPEFAGAYGARELPAADYPARTRANARDSDATVWFGSGDSRGFGCTANACRREGRPFFPVDDVAMSPAGLAAWIESRGVKVLNVAGNRASKAPGIGAAVENYLCDVFRELGFQEEVR